MSKQHSNNSAPTAREFAARLRLLYSWRDCLESQPAAGRAARRRADREIEAARAQIQQHIARLGEDLQRVYAADRDRPGNLVIEEKLRNLRHGIQQWNALLKATTAAELGGSVTLPLSHYPIELGLARRLAGVQLGRDDFITLGVAAAAIAISSLGIAWYNLWRENVAFDLTVPARGLVAVNFHNRSNFVASLYGPWPEGSSGLVRRSYGVRLFARAEGADELRECTSLRDAWGYRGETISPLKPIQVEPGVTVTIELLVPALEKLLGEEVAELRIDCGNHRNRDDFSFTVELEP